MAKMKVRLLNNGVTDFIHATGTRFVNATFCGSDDFARADHFVHRGECPAALRFCLPEPTLTTSHKKHEVNSRFVPNRDLIVTTQ